MSKDAINNRCFRGLFIATIIVIVLIVIAIVCDFMGRGGEKETRPLNGAELRYFNEEFFNARGRHGEANLHNQFVSSFYEEPESIDLFNLFYIGMHDDDGNYLCPSAEERKLVWDTELPCPAFKLTTSEIDAFLKQNIGLTLAETEGVGLDKFTYLAKYDAYYWAHGDTNYTSVNIIAGERDGDLIHLYYSAKRAYACITLREVEGGYHIVSNLASERPTIPTVLPSYDPIVTIPLNSLTPYDTPQVTVNRRNGDCLERFYGIRLDKGSVRIYRSTDGNLYAAMVYAEAAGHDRMLEWDVGCFLTLPSDMDVTPNTIQKFSDLFGHDGISISYNVERSQGEYIIFHDYYYLVDDKTPVLLARAYGDALIIDLNGDGVNELVADEQLFFMNDNTVYQAYLPDLLEKNWPEMYSWDDAVWDVYNRCLSVHGLEAVLDWQETVVAFTRYIYFNGNSLLVYKDSDTDNHIVDGTKGPDEVLDIAKDKARAAYQATKAGKTNALTDQNFDNWRVSSLKHVDTNAVTSQWPDLNIEVYIFDYQFHTTTPELLKAAGEACLDENGWFGGFYQEESPYLVFQLRDGERHLLENLLPNGRESDDLAFNEGLLRTLIFNNIITLNEIDDTTSPTFWAQAAMDCIMRENKIFMELITADKGGGPYSISPSVGLGRNRANYFTSRYEWAFTDIAYPPNDTDTLIIETGDGKFSFQFWQSVEFVRCDIPGRTLYFHVANSSAWDDTLTTSIFDFIRVWYDEAEIIGLIQDIVIPNQGQSYQEIAQAWVGANNGVALLVTPGSKFACTYVRNIVTTNERIPNEVIPENPDDKERFYFTNTHIFVPENERALNHQMNGDTDNYDGSFGKAPLGALMNTQFASMYLTEDGWHYDGSSSDWWVGNPGK